MNSLLSRLRARRFATTWAVVLLLVAASFTMAYSGTRPPPDGEAGRRALATVEQLQDLGVRVVGAEALSQGLDLVSDKLEAIPGLEVDRQRASGTYRFEERDVAYTVENVVARQPGDTDDALLVNVHVDSAFEGVGAADDGVAVGAVIEAARELVGDTHRRTIIYLFNGGEEVGLAGADAFTQHPWAKDVRWFLNLEAVGSGGLPILFNAGEGGSDLVEIAGNAPRPFGSVIGQALFDGGLINSDTDSRVWRGEGWSGLDYALFEDGYAYHTALDRVERVGPGSAQAYVDLTTQLARDVTSKAQVDAAHEVPAYFDVQSRWWVTLDRTTSKIGTLALVLIVALLVWRARRTWGTRVGHVITVALAALLGIPFGVLGGVAAGGLMYAVGGSHAWYAHPWLAYVVFLPLAVLGALAPQLVVHGRHARRDPSSPDAARVALLASAAVVSTLGAVTAWLEFGPAYLLWISSALLVAATGCAVVLRGVWRVAPLVVTTLLQCLLIAEFARNLMTLAIPMMGRLPVGIAMDPVIGAVVAIVAVLLALTFAPFVFHAGHARRFVVTTVAITVCGLAVAVLVPPYTVERPKYVAAFHVRTNDDRAWIELEGRDFHTPTALGLLDEVARETGLAVEDSSLKASDVDVPSGSVDFGAGDPVAPLELTIGPNDANLVRITVTGHVDAVDGRAFDGNEAVVDIVGRPEGHTATVERSGPVRVEVDQVFLDIGHDVRTVLDALPPWVVGHGRTIVQDTFADGGCRSDPTCSTQEK